LASGQSWDHYLWDWATEERLHPGLIDQTLFNPPELAGAADGATAYVPALDINVSDLLSFVVGHAIWSIAVPIAMVEALVPGRRTTPWLDRRGLAVTGVLYLLGAASSSATCSRSPGGLLASAPKLAAVAGVFAALIWLAFSVAGKGPSTSSATWSSPSARSPCCWSRSAPCAAAP
jgi:hypothetical protein